jgi:hypothetical protein
MLLEVIAQIFINGRSRPLRLELRVGTDENKYKNMPYKSPILGLMDRGLAAHYECTIFS